MLLIRKVAPFKIIPLQKDSLTIIPCVLCFKKTIKVGMLKSNESGLTAFFNSRWSILLSVGIVL